MTTNTQRSSALNGRFSRRPIPFASARSRDTKKADHLGTTAKANLAFKAVRLPCAMSSDFGACPVVNNRATRVYPRNLRLPRSGVANCAAAPCLSSGSCGGVVGPDAEQHAYSHPRPEHGSSVSDDSHCGGDLVGIGPFHKVSTRPRLHGGVVTVVRPWALVIENVPPSSSAR